MGNRKRGSDGDRARRFASMFYVVAFDAVALGLVDEQLRLDWVRQHFDGVIEFDVDALATAFTVEIRPIPEKHRSVCG